MKRYLKAGRRLSLSLTRYQPRSRQYVRTGKTRTTAVETEREETAFWRHIEAAVDDWEKIANTAK
jgi:hypothetical protein